MRDNLVSPVEYAQLMYEAYGSSSEWKNYAGLPMPMWDELPENIKTHWRAVEKFVADDLARFGLVLGKG